MHDDSSVHSMLKSFHSSSNSLHFNCAILQVILNRLEYTWHHVRKWRCNNRSRKRLQILSIAFYWHKCFIFMSRCIIQQFSIYSFKHHWSVCSFTTKITNVNETIKLIKKCIHKWSRTVCQCHVITWLMVIKKKRSFSSRYKNNAPMTL